MVTDAPRLWVGFSGVQHISLVLQLMLREGHKSRVKVMSLWTVSCPPRALRTLGMYESDYPAQCSAETAGKKTAFQKTVKSLVPLRV